MDRNRDRMYWEIEPYADINNLEDLKKERRKMEEKYETSTTKIQHVPYYMRNLNKYEKYYFPNLISIGPAHDDPRLSRGREYKVMWMLMYAEESRKTPQFLYQRIFNNIAELRGLFSPELLVRISDVFLARMLLVDGCAMLQIMEKATPSEFKDLKVKIDIQVIIRDLFLLENQLPYKVLELLCKDETELKISMYRFCKLHNTFTVLESPHSLRFKDAEDRIEILKKSSPPNHLLDCLRRYILVDEMASIGKDQCQINVAITNANKKEKYISYRNIQELKACGIQVKRQKNVSLNNISFRSSCFGGKLHLPPLILEDSTVTVLLNLVAYEMCPDFENNFEICSYVKLLDLLIDSAEDVKELRSSRVLHNSLGSDEEVVELFNAISSGLMHNPDIYSGIREVMEKHYKKKLSIWVAEAYYSYFKSPWTIIAFLAALIALVLTALQTWLAFKSS
ncbi:hypothetical protein L6164_007786 [Bauhinia variegata]|uniref:Uncharacterized protein n=1 Tax=Bauhinia variegata TaxID=167791 RepID=A0ACB9PEN5_BAUVA|nr:hypothetical protein L6164_007786 [Bauhinia variegata]